MNKKGQLHEMPPQAFYGEEGFNAHAALVAERVRESTHRCLASAPAARGEGAASGWKLVGCPVRNKHQVLRNCTKRNIVARSTEAILGLTGWQCTIAKT